MGKGGSAVGMAEQDDTPDATHTCDIMIDAAASLDDLPFKTCPPPKKTFRAPFKLDLKTQNPTNIYCLAMPQLLDRHPFAQGLVNVAELAEVVARDFCGGEGGIAC